MSLNATIYEGAWTDWGQDSRLLGATLTLKAKYGKYLISFLSVFIALVGGQVWQILCRIAFRFNSSPMAMDALSHQQQAILRNSNSDWSALNQLLSITWGWRRRAKRLTLRSSPLILLTVLHISGFLAASILSSRISSDRANVLLVPNDCGTWQHATLPSSDDLDQWSTWSSLRMLLGQNLAASQAVTTCSRAKNDMSQCSPLGRNLTTYDATCQGVNATLYRCNALGMANVRTHVDSSPNCPFDSTMCTSGIVFTLDSGLVDSYHDLGINSAKHDRIQYRNKLACAPITTTGFAQVVGEQDYRYTFYHYGSDGSNYTFWHTSLDSSAGNFGGFAVARPFQVVMLDSTDHFDLGSFQPITQLSTDGNTVLMFLQRNIVYITPTSDPWFTNDNEDTVGVLGCVDRRYYCNGQSKCTPVSYETRNISSTLGLNTRQTAILNRMNRTIAESSFFMSNSVSAQALLANDAATERTLSTLPNNQWMAELQNWFSVGLLQLQLQTTQYVTQLAAGIEKVAPTDEDEWMCASQIVVRGDYTSFSILGLAMVLIIGGTCIGINLCLDSVVATFDKRFNKDPYKALEWKTDGLLQLQRHAYEGRGIGQWVDVSADVPVTRYNETLGLPLHEDSRSLQQHVDGGASSVALARPIALTVYPNPKNTDEIQTLNASDTDLS